MVSSLSWPTMVTTHQEAEEDISVLKPTTHVQQYSDLSQDEGQAQLQAVR